MSTRNATTENDAPPDDVRRVAVMIHKGTLYTTWKSVVEEVATENHA